MRHEESAKRIGTLVLLEIVSRRNHARGPAIKRVIAGEWLRQLLGAVERQRLGWLTWPHHTLAQKQKSRERKSLRVDVVLDTLNFGSDIGFVENVKCACAAGLT
jgi:hypothetical protein